MPRARTSPLLCTAILATQLCAAQYTIQHAPGPSIMQLPDTGAEVSILYTPKSSSDLETFSVLDFKTRTHTWRLTSRYPLKYFLKTDEPGIHPADPIRGLEMDRARFFFTGRYTADAKPHTLLFFIGDSRIEGAPLLVVGFRDDGSPYKLLELAAFNLFSFEHSDPPDGKPATITGKPTLSQVMAGDGSAVSRTPYATTYDPYFVYIVQPGAPAQYSLAASKLYNQQHYVWAGPRSREDYAVVYNLPGHPKLFGIRASRLGTVLK